MLHIRMYECQWVWRGSDERGVHGIVSLPLVMLQHELSIIIINTVIQKLDQSNSVNIHRNLVRVK